MFEPRLLTQGHEAETQRREQHKSRFCGAAAETSDHWGAMLAARAEQTLESGALKSSWRAPGAQPLPVTLSTFSIKSLEKVVPESCFITGTSTFFHSSLSAGDSCTTVIFFFSR